MSRKKEKPATSLAEEIHGELQANADSLGIREITLGNPVTIGRKNGHKVIVQDKPMGTSVFVMEAGYDRCITLTPAVGEEVLAHLRTHFKGRHVTFERRRPSS